MTGAGIGNAQGAFTRIPLWLLESITVIIPDRVDPKSSRSSPFSPEGARPPEFNLKAAEFFPFAKCWTRKRKNQSLVQKSTRRSVK
jgi:hypothetical protein